MPLMPVPCSPPGLHDDLVVVLATVRDIEGQVGRVAEVVELAGRIVPQPGDVNTLDGLLASGMVAEVRRHLARIAQVASAVGSV
jgi:hypothetical protein